MNKISQLQQCILLCNSLKSPNKHHQEQHPLQVDNGTLSKEPKTSLSEDHLEKAVQYFEKKQFQLSLHHLNTACSKITENATKKIALYNRCTVLLRQSCEIRYRPAKVSDTVPLNGSDPYILTISALRDAQNLLKLCPGDADLYVKFAFAQYLLEDYNKALQTCYRAWSLDPSFPLTTVNLLSFFLFIYI